MATTDFSSRYDKKSESARSGSDSDSDYYTTTLREHGARVVLTASQRVALHRYTFKRTGRDWGDSVYRPLLPAAGTHAFGGAADGSENNPLIIDDTAVITLP